MSEAHKHRARIFLHRGDLVQARAAWEAAVGRRTILGNSPIPSATLVTPVRCVRISMRPSAVTAKCWIFNAQSKTRMPSPIR